MVVDSLNKFKTLSICNICYRKIPATISYSFGSVYIRKECCGVEQREMIERSEEFYRWVLTSPYTNLFGSYCNLDITNKCNTSCAACYSDRGKEEMPIEEIIGLANSSPTHIKKFLLTGGEPTLHSGFFDIVSQLDCGLITNGIRFSDFSFLKEYTRFKVFAPHKPKELSLMLSLNTPYSQDYEKRIEAIENIGRLGLRIGMVCSTITDLDEIPLVLEEFKKLRHIVNNFKIRSAFNIGASSGFKHIYLSELVRKVAESVKDYRPLLGFHTNTYLLTGEAEGMFLVLVKCPDKTTIDLGEIGPTGPWQYTHFSTLEDVMVALIVNEGISKGYFAGVRVNKKEE